MIVKVNPEQFALHSCTVCHNSQGSRTYATKEMMFGLRTEFHYAECATCGSVWLVDPPGDLSPYYPQGYYSFDRAEPARGLRHALVRGARLLRDRSYFGEGGIVGRFLAERYNNPALRAALSLDIERHSRILDVGCGSGHLLLRMQELGFRNLAGVDPFIAREIHYRGGLSIHKRYLEQLDGECWDAIMFHHSLEHVPDPAVTLKAAGKLLSEHGQCLVRLPVVSWAWEQYRSSWVGLDPPRHFWLPTEKGMAILAESVGLKVTRVDYDSSEVQFWASELYARDHAYIEVGPRLDELNKFFNRRQLREFREKSKVLNQQGRGDTAAFVLEKLA